ncbi:unknown protein [Parachlamydia acanthamoebae UV-7]|uniref:Uncharacterized protein n=1 Tax=Parachlamydia acanthamoebae (strain UV7) TaxID=765952 RepID=F8KW12_PARAV|nr:unknown protein [Parachlamydia acanthamoebae UV-7]
MLVAMLGIGLLIYLEKFTSFAQDRGLFYDFNFGKWYKCFMGLPCQKINSSKLDMLFFSGGNYCNFSSSLLTAGYKIIC